MINQIHIVGLGAIGGLIAGKALRAGLTVSTEIRSESSAKLKTLIDTDNHRVDLSAIKLAHAPISSDCLVLVCTKAYQVESALQEIDKKVSDSTPIVLLNNGMLDKRILSILSSKHIYRGTTSYAARKIDLTTVKATGNGTSVFGSNTRNPGLDKAIESVLDRILGPAHYVTDICDALWRKLIINSVINPLTAFHNIPNGALDKPDYTDEISRLIDEALRVARLENVKIKKDQMTDQLYQVIRATAKNYSSMHQDIVKHAPTEIEFINGYLLRLASQHGIKLNSHSQLYRKVIELQNS